MFHFFVFLICFSVAVIPPHSNGQTSPRQAAANSSSLTGVYRIDIPESDKLYSVVAGASSNVPFSEQQRFFIDLAVRLTPPDLLAIEQRGRNISLGSSRAQRMTFVADGITRTTRAADGHSVTVRLSIEDALGNPRIVFRSSGRTEDNLTVVFESIDAGKRLRVVRRIAAEALDRPLVIRTIYNKISDLAHWDLYGETQLATAAAAPTKSSPGLPTQPNPAEKISAAGPEPLAVDVLRSALREWINATKGRDIDRQMSFYVPRLKAYYLTRNTSRSFVREEKARVFATASLIDIQAEEPEIVFQDGGNVAIMRYRKKYRIENGRQSRRGQVIQELRWQRVGSEWRIFSERDIRVL